MTTDWFPDSVLPIRDGWYEVAFKGDIIKRRFFSYVDKWRFLSMDSKPFKWRGLASDSRIADLGKTVLGIEAEVLADAARYREMASTSVWYYSLPPMRAVSVSWHNKLTKKELDTLIDARIKRDRREDDK